MTQSTISSTGTPSSVTVSTDNDGTGKVCIAFLFPGQVRGEFAVSLLGIAFNEPQNIGSVISRASGPLIAPARNMVVRQFLEDTNSEWLLFVDSDMVLEQDTITRMVEAAHPTDRPILGALCFGRDADGYIFPTVYRYLGEGGFARAEHLPTDQLVEVDATGTGCILIHRTVLEKLDELNEEPYKWFHVTQLGKKVVGEDITFCFRCRDAGYPIYVHTGIQVGHIKETMLDLGAHLRWKKDHRYLFCGAPRAGLRYITDLLNNCALVTGYQEAFNTTTQIADFGGFRGEASWMAAPYLPTIKATSTNIIHLVRHPVANVLDLTQTPLTAEEQSFLTNRYPNLSYVDHDLEWAMKVVYEWNRRIEPYASARVKIDQMDLPALHQVLKHLGTKRSDEDLNYALGNTPTGITSAETGWNALPDSPLRVQLREMATEYGYPEE